MAVSIPVENEMGNFHALLRLLVAQDVVHYCLEVFKSFLDGACRLVDLVHLVFPRPRSSGPVFIQLCHPTLEERAQDTGAIWIVDVCNKTHVKKAWNSSLKRLKTTDERLLLHQEVKDHFPETTKNNTGSVADSEADPGCLSWIPDSLIKFTMYLPNAQLKWNFFYKLP